MVKELLGVFRPPKDDEAETLCLCIEAIVQLFNKNLLNPLNFKKDI
jgi:hypothetical protein